ncbi:MAG: hypothetical protein ONB23_01365 [candidate division KSB1 bacterium]|nr:hypothetical protein [candidate division KSB1 bacterium]
MSEAEKVQLDKGDWSLDRLLEEYDVSLESVLRVLVRRGIVSPAEIAQEEEARRERRRAREEELRKMLAVQQAQTLVHDSSYRRPRSWLKRVMAKRRWTRRLGTFLFGWKWKKVYHRSSHSIEPTS